MESNITTLVEKAKKGDTDAFGILYYMFYPKIKGICINILKEDKDVVDDLVQDAFILALISIKNLKNSKRFSQWLTSITTNLALKYKDRSNKQQFISLATLSEETIEGTEEEVISESAITYDRLMAAIEQLPEGYRNVFKMYVLDGLSHQEIAAILNIAPHTPSSQLARAKAMLKGLLNIKTVTVIILALIGIPIYKDFLNKKQTLPQKETSLASNERTNKMQGDGGKDIPYTKNERPDYLKPRQYTRTVARNTNVAVGHDTAQTTRVSSSMFSKNRLKNAHCYC